MTVLAATATWGDLLPILVPLTTVAALVTWLATRAPR